MPEKDEKHVEVPLLEDYDTTIPDSQTEADDSLSSAPKSKPIPTRKRRALALFLLFVWFYFIFTVSFYLFSFLGNHYHHTLHVLNTAASKTYGGMTDTYQSITNPATREEVVDLMTELYELLAEMGYYDAAMIGRPPHNPGINRTLAAELEFSLEAVEMMEMLPYLQQGQEEGPLGWGADNNFLLSGTFADLRDDGVLSFTRDPMFAIEDSSKGFDEDGGKYMRPNYVCLSLPGEGYGAIMILDVKTRRFQGWSFQWWLISGSQTLDYRSRSHGAPSRPSSEGYRPRGGPGQYVFPRERRLETRQRRTT